MVKTTRRERRFQNRSRRCKICRCKPCKCKEEIHCYRITYSKTRKRKNTKKRENTKKRKNTRKKSKKKRRSSQKGGFCPVCLAGPALGVAVLGPTGYMATRKK